MTARRFLVGTSKGLYLCALDASGRIDVLDVCAVDDPSFVVAHPRLPLAYAVNETRGQDGGVSVVDIAGDRLTVRQRVDSLGQLPCHLALLHDARAVAVVHYGCGTVATFQLDHDGALTGVHRTVRHAGASVDSRRQASAHPHCVVIRGASAYVTDLGQDCIIQYRADSLSERSRCAIHAGAGPRHLCFDESRMVGWLSNELDNTVSRLPIAADGSLREIDWVSSLPAALTLRSSTSEIARHPNGRWLYVGNRGHDSIAWYSIDRTGALDLRGTVATQGRHPRHFALTGDGSALVVANRDSDNLACFAIDSATGEPNVLSEPFGGVPTPTCVRWF
jgi:6-phosphogluconolactonase